MSQTNFWIVKSTRAGVTINSVSVSIDDKKDSPWLMPSQFKKLINDHHHIDEKSLARNYLVKKIKSNTVNIAINVISFKTGINGWSCSFYGTFDESLARSIHKNEVLRIQTQYMLIF